MDTFATTTSKMGTIPTQNDVLFGRGALFDNHQGNQLYRSLVKAQKTAFRDETRRKNKRAIAVNIKQEVHNMGGRFLAEDQTGDYLVPSYTDYSEDTNTINPFLLEKVWVEVSDDKAMVKIMHILREKDKTRGVDGKNSIKNEVTDTVTSNNIDGDAYTQFVKQIGGSTPKQNYSTLGDEDESVDYHSLGQYDDLFVDASQEREKEISSHLSSKKPMKIRRRATTGCMPVDFSPVPIRGPIMAFADEDETLRLPDLEMMNIDELNDMEKWLSNTDFMKMEEPLKPMESTSAIQGGAETFNTSTHLPSATLDADLAPVVSNSPPEYQYQGQQCMILPPVFPNKDMLSTGGSHQKVKADSFASHSIQMTADHIPLERIGQNSNSQFNSSCPSHLNLQPATDLGSSQAATSNDIGMPQNTASMLNHQTSKLDQQHVQPQAEDSLQWPCNSIWPYNSI